VLLEEWNPAAFRAVVPREQAVDESPSEEEELSA
jgi:hypothetical protein